MITVVDPFDFVKANVDSGTSCFLGHADLRDCYGDQSIYRMAYLMLSTKFSKIYTEASVKKFNLGDGKPDINIDFPYLHGMFSLDELPESDTYAYFCRLVKERLVNNSCLPSVDYYFARGGGYYHDFFDWVTLHRLAEMQYYIDQGVPVCQLPTTAYFSNKKLLNIFVGVMQRCKFVMAREVLTHSWMSSVGITDNLVLSWDLSFLENQKDSATDSGVIGVVVSSDRAQTKDFELMVEKNSKLLFFSTAPKKDERRLRYASVESGGEYKYISSVDDLLTCVASCDLVVSDRFHGVVFAMLHGIPVLPLKDRTFQIRGLVAMSDSYSHLVPLNYR